MRRWFGRRPLPPMPENIRLVLVDGRELAVDAVYVGPDETGSHLWEVIMPPDLQVRVASVKVAVLPAMTGLRMDAAAFGWGFKGGVDNT